MKQAFFLAVFCTLILAFSNNEISYAKTPQNTFESPHFSVKMNYPDDWTVIEGELDFTPGIFDYSFWTPPGVAEIAIFCPSSEVEKVSPKRSECQSRPIVGITVYRLAENTSLEKFVRLEKLDSRGHEKLDSPGETHDYFKTELSGLPAHQRIDLSSSAEDETSKYSVQKPVTGTHIYTVKNDIAYQLNFATDNPKQYDQFLPIFQDMVNAFEITGQTETQSENTGQTETQSENTDRTDNISANTKLLSFEDPSRGYRIKYPGDYQVVEGKAGTIFKKPEDFVSFGVVTSDHDGRGLNVVVEQLAIFFGKLGYKVIDPGKELEVAGIPAEMIIKEDTRDGLMEWNIFMIKDNQLYEFMVAAPTDTFQQYTDLFYTMLNSFEFL